MTKHGIEGLSDDPKYWITREQREREEKIRCENVEIITKEIMAFHPDRNADDLLAENLMIDFEMNDVNTLIAIVGAFNELKSIIVRLSENGGKL